MNCMTDFLYDIRTNEQAQRTLSELTNVPIYIWKQYMNQEPKYEIENFILKIIKEHGSFPPVYRTFDFLFSHITTSSDGCESIRKNGLLDLQQSYRCNDSELRKFLEMHGVHINIRSKVLRYNGQKYDISLNNRPKTDSEQKTWAIALKFYDDYSVNGFLSIDTERPYGGRIHKRPEILMNIDKLLKLNLSGEWEETHQPYEITAKICGKSLVCQTDNHLSDKRKTLSYIISAFDNAFFAPREIICRLKGHTKVSSENIQIESLKNWK